MKDDLKLTKGTAIVDQAAKAAITQTSKPQIIVLASPKLNLDQLIQEKQQEASLSEREINK